MLTTQQKKQIIDILTPYHPVRIGIFGSYARSENRSDSDLDILIQLKESIGLLKLVALEQQLSDSLGVKVDLVTEGAVKNELLKEYINQDLIAILG